MSENVMSENATSEHVSQNRTAAVHPSEQDSAPVAHESRLSSMTDAGEFTVEAYADRLMDELFSDLERAMDRGANLPVAPVKPQPAAESLPLLESLPSPLAAAISAAISAPVATSESEMASDLATASAQSGPAIAEMPLTEEPAIDHLLPAAEPEAERRWGFGKSFDSLLMMVTYASLLAAGVIWLVLKNAEQRVAPVASAPVAASPSIAPEDTQFLDYVQRSLTAIDRRADASRQVATAAGQVPNGALPSGALPNIAVGSSPLAPGSLANGANGAAPERVYIPVYQPPQALAPTNATGLPSVAPAVPTVPGAPVAAAPAITAPNIANSATHVLVGLLEQGDRSAALFEVNNTVQRINLGEAIGSSGWTLVAVQNNEAIVRRNGEVRSVYVGQQF
ncbi:MAG TPA: hypothetical protein V6C88_05190 [Chroococcidiopsis sp.]